MVVAELPQLLMGALGLGIAYIYSFLQALGGRGKDQIPSWLFLEHRLWGRWIAPVFFSASVCALSVVTGQFQLYFLMSLVAYKLATHIGHGGKTFLHKLLRRTLWTLIRTSCSLLFVMGTGAWMIYITQVLIGLIVTNIWGIKNPQPAPREEMVINFSNVFLVPFMVMS